jgi:hypothetical protein
VADLGLEGGGAKGRGAWLLRGERQSARDAFVHKERRRRKGARRGRLRRRRSGQCCASLSERAALGAVPGIVEWVLSRVGPGGRTPSTGERARSCRWGARQYSVQREEEKGTDERDSCERRTEPGDTRVIKGTARHPCAPYRKRSCPASKSGAKQQQSRARGARDPPTPLRHMPLHPLGDPKTSPRRAIGRCPHGRSPSGLRNPTSHGERGLCSEQSRGVRFEMYSLPGSKTLDPGHGELPRPRLDVAP